MVRRLRCAPVVTAGRGSPTVKVSRDLRRMGDSVEEERSILTAGGVPRFTALSLLILRVASFVIACFFTGQLIHTINVDGSPFRASLLTPWMVTTLYDFYLVMLPLLLLIMLRHRARPLLGVLACLFLCSLGTTATWLYLFAVFYGLRVGDPVTRLLNC